MKEPDHKPEVKLLGEDGNAFHILGKAKKALENAGADDEFIKMFLEEVADGYYNHLLQTVMKYCKVV